MEITYCEDCLNGKCSNHRWFTDKNPQSDKEVLILLLELISGFEIREVFRKVYIVENVMNEYDNHWIDVAGELVFSFKEIPTVHKKDDRYVPVSLCSLSDNVLSYDIKVKVTMMRHHPTELIIKKDLFKDDILYHHTLIDFMDNLHCESIEDYPKIIALAISRITELINQIKI